MNRWIESIDFSTFGAALLLSGMGLWFTVIIPKIDRWSRRFFMSFFILYMLCCLTSIIEVIFQHEGVPKSLFMSLLLLESLLFALPLLMLTAYLLHCCNEKLRSSKLFHAVFSMWAIYFVMLFSTLFIEGFLDFKAGNQYGRGPLYPIPLVPLIAVQLLNFAGTIRRRKYLSRKVFLAFLVAILPIMIALTVHLFVEVFSLIDVSYVLSALAMYSLVLSDQIEQDRRHQQEIVRQQQKITQQQQEIAQERASVMVLQMRPHFIYNTLMSIYSLCRLDPGKAQQITLDFTNYLRKNFNAIASEKSIPFSEELEHTRAYLAVEQAQYDDMLVVDYDTPFIRFRLPSLTLQPIVENAVKHGMNPYTGPLHINIRTRNTDIGAEIIVENNGTDFNPADDPAPHFTLTNIQQRLKIMCGGRMDIVPRDGGGTVVKLMIPC